MNKIILTALLSFVLPSMALANASGFASWKQQTAAEARAKGFKEQTINVFLDDATYLPKVIELDRKQPEGRMTFLEYYNKVIDQNRIDTGRAKYRTHYKALKVAEDKYAVPAEIITALWGIETSYGGYTGNWGVLSTLSTLAYEGRRAEFFKKQLFAAMTILEAGDIEPRNMRGSWAGAMGQSQFMPTSFLAYAQDANNDGKRDIWGDLDDVFASAANYLRTVGWDNSVPWGTRVSLSRELGAGFIGLEPHQARPYSKWRELGFTPDGGRSFQVSGSTPLWLVAPDGMTGPKYLVTKNYKVIMDWNKSTYFATSVGRLSDLIVVGSGYAQGEVGGYNE